MKLRIGTKLSAIRQERQLTQDELADFLGISTSAYARFERNETSMDLDILMKVSKKLDVPVHEFLPETFQINNNPNYSQGGIVFGNFYYYANPNDANDALQKENESLKKEIEKLQDKANNQG
jgi:transcriptional regulator with XRE-family HTH domain